MGAITLTLMMLYDDPGASRARERTQMSSPAEPRRHKNYCFNYQGSCTTCFRSLAPRSPISFPFCKPLRLSGDDNLGPLLLVLVFLTPALA
jgi:hypothetical protein